MSFPLKASLIILTYNNLDLTRMCLDSIYAKTDYLDFEVIIVDNASKDDTPQYLQQQALQHPNLKIILNDKNEGFSRGNNIGAAAAIGDYLIFINNDIVVTRGWLSGLIRCLQDPKVGMVGPVTNFSGNETRIAVDYKTLDEMDEFAEQYTQAHQGKRFEIKMLPFICVALRRQVYEKIGLLDERFGMGMFEDDDYALRLRQNSYKILCLEDVFVHHWGSASFSKLDVSQYWQLFNGNLQLFETKWGEKWEPQLYRQELLSQQIRQMVDGAIFLSTHIAEQVQKNETLWAQLLERDNVIAVHNQKISELDHKVVELGQRLNEREQRISQLDQQLSERDNQLVERDQKLQEITHSRAWRLVQFLWRIRVAILPPNSFLAKTIRLIVHSLRIWKHQGILMLIRKVISKMIHASRIKQIILPLKKILPSPLLHLLHYLQEYKRIYPHKNQSTVILYAEPSILPTYLTRQPLEPLLAQPKVKVSLISTVLNEGENAKEWLESLLNQSRNPDEIVIIDGGSTDDTVKIIQKFTTTFPIAIKLIEAPGTNISQGRNIAIQNAAFPIIACTDFGCVLDKDWLRYLILPFDCDEKIQVSAGFYQPIIRDPVDRLHSSFFIPELSTVNPQDFLPSSRSIAVKKELLIDISGYPEWLTDAGEDTLFDLLVKELPTRWAFVPKALVSWHPPRNAYKMFRTFFRYARGDGQAGMFTHQYWVKTVNVLWNVFWGGCFIIASIVLLLVLKLIAVAGLLIILIIAALNYLRDVRFISAHQNLNPKLAILYKFYKSMMLYVQVFGFAKGVAERPQVNNRKLKFYSDQLKRIVSQHLGYPGIIVYPPTHDWGFMFQRPQQMARSFARSGYLYLYCTNNEKTDTVIGFKEIEPNLYLCHAPVEIFQQIEKPIVYIGSPWLRNWLSNLDHPLVIYDHYDDIKVSSARPEDHQALLQDAHIVLVSSQRLQEAIIDQRSDAILTPNGVDYDHILKACRSNVQDLPSDLKPILLKKKPIIGYSGALAEWFDYDLLAYAADARPGYEFILIGVNYDGSLDQSQVLKLYNVHWLGMKAYEELYKYMCRFDVGIIPFKINEITMATSPIKLFEYMACELPPVTTNLPECKSVPGIMVAENYKQFVDYLDTALNKATDEEYIAQLKKIARRNTWASRVQKIIESLSNLAPSIQDNRIEWK